MKHLIFLIFLTFFAHTHASDERKKSKSKPSSLVAAASATENIDPLELLKSFFSKEDQKKLRPTQEMREIHNKRMALTLASEYNEAEKAAHAHNPHFNDVEFKEIWHFYQTGKTKGLS